jgi:hypothetical protein
MEMFLRKEGELRRITRVLGPDRGGEEAEPNAYDAIGRIGGVAEMAVEAMAMGIGWLKVELKPLRVQWRRRLLSYARISGRSSSPGPGDDSQSSADPG